MQIWGVRAYSECAGLASCLWFGFHDYDLFPAAAGFRWLVLIDFGGLVQVGCCLNLNNSLSTALKDSIR